MTGNLPVVSIPALCPHSDAFAKLLESGDLSMSSVRVDGISMSFQNLLAKICFHHHFSGKGPDGAGGRAQPPCTGGPHALTPARSVAVVECVGSCASLYSRSIQGHHVCLLVKKVSARPPPAPPAPSPCPTRARSSECSLAAPPRPGELVVVRTAGLPSPVGALVARGGSSLPSCSLWERPCACDACVSS